MESPQNLQSFSRASLIAEGDTALPCRTLILDMKRLDFTHQNIRFALSEIPLADTVVLRSACDFPDKFAIRELNLVERGENHLSKNFEHNQTTVALDFKKNQWLSYLDIRFSLNKYLRGGTNRASFRRPSDFTSKLGYELMMFQHLLRQQTGIENLNIYRLPFVRFDVAANFRCQNPTDAETLRDYLFEKSEIPNLVKNPNPMDGERDTRYFNNRGYVNDGGTLERAFVLYATGNICRLETRFHTTDAVRALVQSALGKNLALQNSLSGLLDAKTMSRIFWRDSLHFFDEKDRARIITAYDLNG